MAYRLRVKEVLKDKNVSIGKLSRGADIPIGMVRRMVNDPTYNPTGATLAKVSKYLNVPMEALFYDDEDLNPNGSEPSQ